MRIEAERIRRHEDKLLLVLTLVIGALVGLVVVAFILLTENLGSRAYPAGGSAWRRLLIPVAGAFITGVLMYRYFPDARGSGIPQTKAALFLRGGFISFRTVLGKFGLCSASLASGIALGREGPSVQVGAGIASVLGRRLGLSSASIKSLVPVGASAAIAAAFNTPVAAVLFSMEEVMGDLHAPVLGSIVLSSATSWIVLHLLLGDEPLFHVPAYQLVHPVEFLVYAALGVVGGLVSTAFVKLLLWQRCRFLAVPPSRQWLMPTVGGLTVGVLGWYFPQVLGVGYSYVGQALTGQMLAGSMALLVLLKIVATTTCYASGNAGGIFGPSLFIGAMMGGAVGATMHGLLPDYTGSVGAYALVGMGAAFAGIVRVPLTSVIMIFEITRDYSIVVPLMIANLISYFIASRLQKEPIYEALQHQDGIHLPAGARAREALLTVDSAFHPATPVSAEEEIACAAASAASGRVAFPVVDEDGLRGMLTPERLRAAATGIGGSRKIASIVPPPGPPALLNAENFPHVHTDHTLDVALRRLAESHLSALPVVSRSNVRDLLGTISVDDILAAYGMQKPAPEGDTQAQAGGMGASGVLLAGLAVLLIGMAALAGLLNHFYRAERLARAQREYRDGDELMRRERYGEAIERYRDTLSIIHTPAVRLALANALAKAGRLNEAEVYYLEYLRTAPTSGPANRGLAHVYAEQGRTEEAIEHYHRAIYGSWLAGQEDARKEAWLELIDTLGKAGLKQQAQAELISMLADRTWDVPTQKRLGTLLLHYGLAARAAALFGALATQDPRDEQVLAELGEAQFEQDNYEAARDVWRKALEINPADKRVQARLEVCEQKMAALAPVAPAGKIGAGRSGGPGRRSSPAPSRHAAKKSAS